METHTHTITHKNKKKTRIAKTLLLNEWTAGGIIPDLKLHYRDILIKNSTNLHRKKCESVKLIEDKDKNPHTFEHLSFYKEDRNALHKKRHNIQQVELLKLDSFM